MECESEPGQRQIAMSNFDIQLSCGDGCAISDAEQELKANH